MRYAVIARDPRVDLYREDDLYGVDIVESEDKDAVIIASDFAGLQGLFIIVRYSLQRVEESMVELHPAYYRGCKRCKQPIWINVTNVAFGGDRTGFALALHGRYGWEEFANKVYELDLNVAQLRTAGVNATPPGLNLQVIPDRLKCDQCRMPYSTASLNKGRRLLDAGAYNCNTCGHEGFCEFDVLEESVPDIPEDRLPRLVQAIRLGFADPETLLAVASMRIVVAEDSIITLDRLCSIPKQVGCMYCGAESTCRLLDPPPLR